MQGIAPKLLELPEAALHREGEWRAGRQVVNQRLAGMGL